MVKLFLYILTGIAVSFGFFPFEFTFLLGVNTKMMLAAAGLVVLLFQFVWRREAVFTKDFVVAVVYACVVSAIGFFSTVFNSTSDYTYATYVISFLVWMSSSYFIVQMIRGVHGKVSVSIVCNYLVAVCAAQCILALAMDFYSPLKGFVDSFLANEGFMGKVDGRLYGIGCSLDVAGTRFSAVLIMLTLLCFNRETLTTKVLVLYILAWILIAVVGNMIARTTTVGLIVSLVVGLWKSDILKLSVRKRGLRVMRLSLAVVVLTVPLIIHQYNTNRQFRTNIRFAFEGFFSMVETGRWETNSNNRLMTMVVFPDNLKTLMIGDGFFDNPLNGDPYYVGEGIGEYYMSTDIGYLRFIYYFGLIGLAAFCLFFLKVTQICGRRFPHYREMFVLFLILNYIIWFKVATDIFLVFALFLCIPKEEEETIAASSPLPDA